MLVHCPECKYKISSKSKLCINCGATGRLFKLALDNAVDTELDEFERNPDVKEQVEAECSICKTSKKTNAHKILWDSSEWRPKTFSFSMKPRSMEELKVDINNRRPSFMRDILNPAATDCSFFWHQFPSFNSTDHIDHMPVSFVCENCLYIFLNQKIKKRGMVALTIILIMVAFILTLVLLG
tara:strand:- start:139 stop:684 length:546 start_codon:yes stop_codon:yes gene_type:complete